MSKLKVTSGYIGGTHTKSATVGGGFGEIAIDSKEQNTMAGSDRPAGMDSIPKTFNPGKKEPTSQTDMGKVASVSHVEGGRHKDRVGTQVKGGVSGDKGGGSR